MSAVGSSVTHVKVGDRVIAPMLQNTTWSTRIKTKETWQRALPEGDLCQMAQIGMNPITAFLIAGKSLHGFWIVNWLKVPGNRERLTAAFEEIAPLVASGKVVIERLSMKLQRLPIQLIETRYAEPCQTFDDSLSASS
ncbi:hypothetical protein [Paraburkholderia sp. CNPSo 3272]|uniref:hypothetical protein n=1 Tax=Paraburkholderia sp. CNPSo 3272 TaxID=2940931 RepID=UPI0035CCCDCE